MIGALLPWLLLGTPAAAVEPVAVRLLPEAGAPPAAVIEAEVARAPAAIQRGLMGRRELPEGTGMLFLLPRQRVQRFWMKDCFLPLDMIFADREGQVVHVAHEVPPCPEMRVDCPTYSSERPASVVLEVPAGTAARHGIRPGSRLEW